MVCWCKSLVSGNKYFVTYESIKENFPEISLLPFEDSSISDNLEILANSEIIISELASISRLSDIEESSKGSKLISGKFSLIDS